MTTVEHHAGRRVLRPVLMVVVLGLAVHVLLPQVGELHRTLHSLSRVRWEYIVLVVGCSAITYLGAAVSLRAASPVPVRLGRTMEANLASSFTGALAPANLGTLGLIGSYLRACGASIAEAGTAVALDAAAGVVIGIVLLVVSAATVGRVPHPHLALPRHFEVLAGIVIGLLVVGLVALVLWQRRREGGWTRLLHRGAAALRTSVVQLRQAISDPRRAAGLLGGSLLLSCGYIACLHLSVIAFGGHVNLVTTAFVFTAGSMVAAVAPTPGGLGAVEAALVSGLTLFGVASGPAVAGVLLYRLATFWLPIPCGAIALRDLRHRRLVGAAIEGGATDGRV